MKHEVLQGTKQGSTSLYNGTCSFTGDQARFGTPVPLFHSTGGPSKVGQTCTIEHVVLQGRLVLYIQNIYIQNHTQKANFENKNF